MESFRGFSPEALKFLRDLAKHNDRAWFTPRKELYQRELLEPLQALVGDATSALHRAKIPLGGDPKRSAFRIYRDIRFSSDKSPYKINVGAFLRREDSPNTPGGLYIHIQPNQSFMAAGFYRLESPLLQRWRSAMAADPKRFEGVIRTLERGNLQLSESGEALKRMPRGFEAYAAGSIAKFFRLRSFITSEALSDEDVMQARLVERVVSLAKRAKPLLVYGWDIP
jgi:uncharacterized protein (TIGR02453 family)